jgi:flagellin
MTVINTNIKSLIASNALKINNRAMSNAMEQLSTGSRINSAADDAAGLAVTQSMTAQIKGLNQAVRNANDGISLAQTAEGALIEVSNMLQRIRELGVQGANGTLSDTQRGYLYTEARALGDQIDRTIASTSWNGISVLSPASMKFGQFIQAGPAGGVTTALAATPITSTNGSSDFTVAQENHTYKVGDVVNISGAAAVNGQTLSGLYEIKSIANAGAANASFVVTHSAPGGANGATGGGGANAVSVTLMPSMVAIKGADLTSVVGTTVVPNTTWTTSAHATAVLGLAESALNAVNLARANLGAGMNRLTSITDNLTNIAQNLSESRSRILDTDYAAATTELARTQIIQQAGTAVLAQANQQPQSVLALLR